MWSDTELSTINEKLGNLPPQEIIRWAWDAFGRDVVVSSSFQTQSLPLLHMIATSTPEMVVLFLDTGYHFSETLAFRDQVVKSLGLNLQIVKPRSSLDRATSSNPNLYRTDPDLCCYLNKVEPFQLAVDGKVAWITGIRPDQTLLRQNIPVLEYQKDQLLKICPLASWTGRDIEAYFAQYGLPAHPLSQHGYRSIGCAPCTRPVVGGEEARAGRWAGLEKVECGLHLQTKAEPGHNQ